MGEVKSGQLVGNWLYAVAPGEFYVKVEAENIDLVNDSIYSVSDVCKVNVFDWTQGPAQSDYLYETIMYAELNTKSDFCHECGYNGEIKIIEDENKKLIWECPNCKNRDQNKMNVARRTCGYIGTQFWNQGRTQEIKDRELHVGIASVNVETE
jgi:hypothetical protein